ncbi:MAG: hypothetical protein AAGA54_23745 [Myxococcota bacterium]
MPTSRRPLRRRSRAPLAALALTCGVAALAVTEGEAEAAVRGRQGIEIEGAQDRRGFYIGGGLGFGGTFFYVDDFIPATRAELDFGGGVSKNFTLGASLNVMPYLQRDTGVAFGGDIEATGYMWRGLYARGGLGFAGVPKSDETGESERGLSVGLGGKAEAGYEFWISATAAMGVGIIYDARFVPGSTFPRQTLLIGMRIVRF